MRILEVPQRTLEDELIALQALAFSERGNDFVMGAAMALNWLLHPHAVQPSVFLHDSQNVAFKQ